LEASYAVETLVVVFTGNSSGLMSPIGLLANNSAAFLNSGIFSQIYSLSLSHWFSMSFMYSQARFWTSKLVLAVYVSMRSITRFFPSASLE